MHEAVIRTIASVGARIEGASTSLRRMSNGAWIVVAFTGTTFLLVTGSGGSAAGGTLAGPPVSGGAHQRRLALAGGLRRRQATARRVVHRKVQHALTPGDEDRHQGLAGDVG